MMVISKAIEAAELEVIPFSNLSIVHTTVMLSGIELRP